jgi:glycosyltransferase involved in cell wall biosynthesis
MMRFAKNSISHEKMTKIAIINLTGGGISGGYRKYLCNVLPRIAKHYDVEAILCASPESIGAQDWFDPMPSVRFVSCKPFRFLFSPRDVELLRELEEFSPDVIFVPVEREIRFKSVPVVNMIQNMEPFSNSFNENPSTEIIRLWIKYIEGKIALKRSDRIIALSKFVRDFLVKRWNIPNEKIALIYHGINAVRNEDGQRPHTIPKNWERQFLFTAGSIRPARGLEDELSALEHLSSQGLNMIKLVIAGEAGQKMADYQKKLKNWAQKNGLSDRICWAGNLNEKEMAWCYQSCNAFVMTSRVESFGMIGCEAMSHGCVCISADNPCLPELFGDAAIYYPPKDGQALAEAIQTVLTLDDNQRKTMSEKAKKRAAEFSWDVCAEKTVAVLAKAVESR